MRGPVEPAIRGTRRAGSGKQDGVVRAPVAALERDPLAGEEPADDLERLLEPRYAPLHGKPEDAVLRLDRPGAEPEDETAARDLVDGCRHLGDQAGRMEARARDERPEP